MLRFVAMLLCVGMISGCVSYHDSFGNPPPRSAEFDCKQKCGYYDTNMNAIGTGFCMSDCMNSKGYYQ